MKRFVLTILILLTLALAGLEVVASRLPAVMATDAGGVRAPILAKPQRLLCHRNESHAWRRLLTLPVRPPA